MQQEMMRPSSASFYIEAQQSLAKSFVQFLKRERKTWSDGITNEKFFDVLNSYGFEAMSVIALVSRLGAFDINLDANILRILEAKSVQCFNLISCFATNWLL